MYRVAKRPSELTLCDLNECGYVSLSKIRCASEVRDDDAQTVSRRFAMQAKRDGQLRPCIPLFSLDSTIHFAARGSEGHLYRRSSPMHRAKPFERSGVSARFQLWNDEPAHRVSFSEWCDAVTREAPPSLRVSDIIAGLNYKNLALPSHITL